MAAEGEDEDETPITYESTLWHRLPIWCTSTDELPISHHVAPFVSYPPVGSRFFFVKNKLCNKNTWCTVFMLQSVLIFEVRILTQIYNPRWPPWRRIEDTLVFTPNPPLVLKMHCQHCATAMGVDWWCLPLSSLNWGPSWLLFFFKSIRF